MLEFRHEQAEGEVDYENPSAEKSCTLGMLFRYDGRLYHTERKTSVSE